MQMHEQQSCEINLLTNNQFVHKSEQCEGCYPFIYGWLPQQLTLYVCLRVYIRTVGRLVQILGDYLSHIYVGLLRHSTFYVILLLCSRAPIQATRLNSARKAWSVGDLDKGLACPLGCIGPNAFGCLHLDQGVLRATLPCLVDHRVGATVYLFLFLHIGIF